LTTVAKSFASFPSASWTTTWVSLGVGCGAPLPAEWWVTELLA